MMYKMAHIMLTYFFVSLMFFIGCQEERKETPTKGHVTVVVSESVSPVIKQEQEKFEELYQQAHVELQVATSREAVARLFNDSILVIVSARPLNNEEREVQKRVHLTIGEYKIAIDAIAVIVNEKNPVTRLRTTQLDSIFSGSAKSWKNVGGPSTPIEVCLPSRNSANYEIVGTKILHGGNFTSPTGVVKTSLEMLDFVSEHPGSIGMVGLNWLSEKRDNVKVLEIADPYAPDSLGTRGQYFGPHQAHVYRGYYPLTREVYIYSRADQYGVAAGFITFITSAPGQKIILNSGLVPATMPVRLVQLTNKGNTQ
ncbi:MAG: substrate-binding domain-containing protein [Ignavibacteria bacterium]|nr:substrate-binding domain-containing protein [Ignavibacteria bacterium]